MAQSDRVLRILSISESDNDYREIVGHLDCLGYSIHLERVSESDELLKKLEIQPWTVVLFMPSTSALSSRDALAITKKNHPELPFILFSNGIGEEEVANMMKAGAEDVVLLSRSHRLLHVMKRILRENDIKEKELKVNKITHLAYAAREQMLAIVSHDIKNPLSAIQLEAQMLLRVADRHAKSLLSEDVKIQANRILKTTERLKGLIADLLDKNKCEDGLTSLNKTECDISKIFKEVYDSNQLLIRQKEIIIRTSFPKEVQLLLDKNKMFQVLTNLLSNAIKFTPVNGTILLAIEESEKDFIFSISDNGPGLNPSELNLVFEKYWTGSSCGGTGLGLFICKTIIEAHGGHIGVENLPVCGSRFWFSIPKPSEQLISPYWIKDTKRKVIIIDDDDDLREVISWALSKEGFAVHGYSDPKIALESLKNGRHRPQLIIVDYHMDSMKGCEFLLQKKTIGMIEVKECPVLMISASPDEVRSSASAELYKEILAKPLDLEALVENIKKYVS
jgi:signal transduction histidine kinase